MAGVSGLSSDARDIEAAIRRQRAILTRKMYAPLEYVGAYKMHWVKPIPAFTAGLGEMTQEHAKILDALKRPHVEYDKTK